jgi:alkylhydroperoxidase family enzyme
MLKILVERMMRKQEAMTGESADFVRDVYNVAPGGFWRFAMFTPMSHYRKVLPREAYAVAKIAAGHSEDCGPCLQTCVNLALADGVSPEIVRAAVTGDTAAMDERTRTAFEFAVAVCARDIRSEELRPLIEKWWGKAATVELALVIASSRVFPMLKRALGHGQACLRVTIGHETVHAELAAPRAA